MGARRESGIGSSVLLVGEDNPLSTDPVYALWNAPEGCSGHRLQSLILGVREEVYQSIWRTNLCVGKWSTPDAKRRARDILEGIEGAPWTTIVLLGAKVAKAFEFPLPAFSHTIVRRLPDRVVHEVRRASEGDGVGENEAHMIYLPHPSGRNLIWNNHNRRNDARKILSETDPQIPWGEEIA